MMSRTRSWIGFMVVAMAAMLALGGCQNGGGLTPAEAAGVKSTFTTAQATLQEQTTAQTGFLQAAQASLEAARVKQLEAQAAGNAKALADADVQIHNADVEVAKAKDALAMVAKIQHFIDLGTPIITAATNPDGTLNLTGGVAAGAQLAAGAIGGPVGVGIAAGLPLLVSLIALVVKTRDASKAKATAASLADMTQHLTDTHPEAKATLDASATKLLTPGALDLVNETIAAKAVSTTGV